MSFDVAELNSVSITGVNVMNASATALSQERFMGIMRDIDPNSVSTATSDTLSQLPPLMNSNGVGQSDLGAFSMQNGVDPNINNDRTTGRA